MSLKNHMPPAQTIKVVPIPDQLDPLSVYGSADQVIRTIERGFPDAKISVRDHSVSVVGPIPVVQVVAELLEELIDVALGGTALTVGMVEHAISLLIAARRADLPKDMGAGEPSRGVSSGKASGPGESNRSGSSKSLPSGNASDRLGFGGKSNAWNDQIMMGRSSGISGEILSVRGKSIRAKTPGQQAYIDDLESSPIVFGIGPAGTGKTYLAIAEAVAALLRGDVRRIVLTRPAVEAGENLGFLPGSATEKIDPYLRPLFDALEDLLEEGNLPQLMAVGAIEIAPLAYMRGRTLNDSYIILDEAQNTTAMQMKMFLTRLGFNSKMVVTGDDTQTDLPGRHPSGLKVVQDVLRDVGNVAFSYLTSADVVRNPLVAEIIDAYSLWESRLADEPEVRTYRKPY